jgi:hypothetical protein
MRKFQRHGWFWILTGLVLAAGCATTPSARPEGGSVNIADVNMAEAMDVAQASLSRMHFVVEKADPQQGLIVTKPLSGGQFFEFWRSDNVGPAQTVEANLHTLRRAVQLQLQPTNGQIRILCTVHVQRLSVPANEVASVSQAYRMYSRSTRTTQRLELEPGQEAGLAWIDQGQDPALADRILKRIVQRMHHQEKDETT